MDFLNKTYTQLSDLFRAMTPAARITSVLLLVAIVVSIAYLFRYSSVGGDALLLGGREFSQKEIAAMEAAFSKAGLNDWVQEGNRLRIPRAQRYSYIAALADENALPKDFDQIMDEVIKNDSPFVSKQLRDIQMLKARQQELGFMISNMKGVERAWVKIDEAEVGGLSRRKEKRVLVGVEAENTRGLASEQVRAIREMVINSVAGLSLEHLTVTDLTSGVAHAGSSPNGVPGADDNLYAAYQLKHEQLLREKIEDFLKFIPGHDVGVYVELSPEMSHRTNALEYKPPTVAIESSTYNKDETSSTPVQGGRPGTVPNATVQANQPAQVTTQEAANSQVSEGRDEQKNLASHQQSIIDKAPFVPTRVKASIAIPTDYFVKVWHKRHDTPGQKPKQPDPVGLKEIEAETKQTVENAVVQLIPFAPGVDPYPLVQVFTYTPTTPELPPEPTSSELAMSWLALNWQTLAVILVGSLSLLMLRGMIRSGDRAAMAAAAATEAAEAGEPEESEEEAVAKEEAINSLLERRLKAPGGGNLREELSEIVKQDPDAAASVLRAWIGDAA